MQTNQKSSIEILRPGCNTAAAQNTECEQHGGNCCASGYCCQKNPLPNPLNG